MNEAVVQFVSSSQNGFVPDSFLQENLVRLQLVQQYIEQEDEEAMLIFADMEKAFDRCSWDFIKRGMHALGFGDGFINFINLAYSEDNPPTRQMYVNGYLSRPFPLGAGIAQGCPISPLLFLVIAEPLSRLINTNVNIEGVVINGVSHKLAQFADDSTFINRPSDLSPTLAMIKIWCRATSMLENAKKREVLLLGKLKRTFHRYPNLRARLSVEPAKDGETIRVLGIPMGNDFDLEKWWMNRYTVVKKRMAAWGALGSVSLVGRSILEQAIVWGSVRFWFFALIVPEAVLKLLEKLDLSDGKPISLGVDNTAARDIAYNPEHHQKVKHIQRRHFFVRECVENMQITVPYVNTVDNLSDFFTKAQDGKLFFRMRDEIMNVAPAMGGHNTACADTKHGGVLSSEHKEPHSYRSPSAKSPET